MRKPVSFGRSFFTCSAIRFRLSSTLSLLSVARIETTQTLTGFSGDGGSPSRDENAATKRYRMANAGGDIATLPCDTKSCKRCCCESNLSDYRSLLPGGGTIIGGAPSGPHMFGLRPSEWYGSTL